MKKTIHPQYYNEAKVTCACGNTFTTGSTKPVISVEVCFKCHPFYTGEQRFIDTQGRIDVFSKKQQLAQEYKKKILSKKQKKVEKEEKKPKTLKELLSEI
jgi:large subunit ribosomal protein L31